MSEFYRQFKLTGDKAQSLRIVMLGEEQILSDRTLGNLRLSIS
ncbi:MULTISPECIES: hypothetical protein [Cyanophyceae]|nr:MULTISPECIES: hypothetical protein [unclassified Trichocoleus]